MTTTSNPPPSRWTRFIPRQFSLRALLLLITIASGVVWLCTQTWGDGITRSAARKVKLGMTSGEVSTLIGAPAAGGGGEVPFYFTYRMKAKLLSPHDEFFAVHFTNGKVSLVEFYRSEEFAKANDAINTIDPSSGPWRTNSYNR